MITKNEGDVKCEAVTDATQGNQCDGEEEEDDDDSDDEDFDPDAVDEDASGRDSDDSKYSGGADSDDDAERRPSTERRVTVPKSKRKSETSEPQRTSDLTTEQLNAEELATHEDVSPDAKKVKIEK